MVMDLLEKRIDEDYGRFVQNFNMPDGRTLFDTAVRATDTQLIFQEQFISQAGRGPEVAFDFNYEETHFHPFHEGDDVFFAGSWDLPDDMVKYLTGRSREDLPGSFEFRLSIPAKNSRHILTSGIESLTTMGDEEITIPVNELYHKMLPVRMKQYD